MPMGNGVAVASYVNPLFPGKPDSSPPVPPVPGVPRVNNPKLGKRGHIYNTRNCLAAAS